MATRYILAHYGDGEPYMETVTENETPFEGTPTYVRAEEYDALEAGLRAIVDRADNGELGSSKVQDMRRIAADLLAKHGGVNTSRTERETVEKGCLNDPKDDPENQNIGKMETELAAFRQTFEFVVRWAWREDPPNANRKLTDGERLSAIKYYPRIKDAWKAGAA